MALFQTTRTQSNNLIEVKAGKMDMRAGSMVHADKRKGLLYVCQSDDSLIHFCWKDRNTDRVEDDLIIFPDDAEFLKVKQCITGRVYVLRMKNSPKRLFFWMQEPKTDKDVEHCKKVNDLLNNPPAAGSRGVGGRSGGGASGYSDQLNTVGQLFGFAPGEMNEERLAEVQQALGAGSLDSQTFMHQFLGMMGAAPASIGGAGTEAGGGIFGSSSGGAGTAGSTGARSRASRTSDSTTTPGIPEATGWTAPPASGEVRSPSVPQSSLGPAGRVQLSDLQNILSGMTIPSESRGTAISLDDVLMNETSRSAANSGGNRDRLVQHLPEQEPVNRSSGELAATMHSPQFRQAVDQFGTALQMGQIGSLLQQFHLPPGAVEASGKGDVEKFAESLQQDSSSTTTSSEDTSEKEKKEDGGPPPEKKDKQDDMELD